ncbi:LPXTG cell wall anchor domain-containing protein [Leuconostoc holzapfelii]|uniref:LPXTG cell wall anchor domain-containing protein n=1 Tax=Leuconostoc holzapfelii TaxID=434464 RepID=UPI0031E59A68
MGGSQKLSKVNESSILPQTGEKSVTTTALLGLGLLMSPLVLKKSKKNKKL